ncbi:DUF1648 domain-containing protein [Paenibacillus sp. CMAA1364]
MDWLSTLILLLMFLPISIAIIFMPYFTRNTVSFGISVSEEMYHSKPLRKLRKKYACSSAILYTLILIIGLISVLVSKSFTLELIIACSAGILVVGSILLHLAFHFKMKKFKLEHPMADAPNKTILSIDTGFRQQKLIFSNTWFLLHLGITISSAVLAWTYYHQFPDTLAMQFDLQGNVTRSVDKSYIAVLGLNMMQFIMTLLFIFINWTIHNSKQQLNISNPQESLRQNVIFRRAWSLYMIITGLLIVLMFSFIQLNMLFELNSQMVGLVTILITTVMVLGALVLSFSLGQGGSRLGRSTSYSNAQPINDDKYWKLGSFYYNPQDPSVWIEKRTGIGWTVNFARPIGWLFLIAIPAVIITISLLLN